MNSANPIYAIATWLVPLVIAIVFHEVAHGLVARHLGDPTAAQKGRLTLNPIRHVDPFGTLILPMVLALAQAPIFGWAKPVPVNYRRLGKPRRDVVLVALAGPGMNLLLGAHALGFAAGWITGWQAYSERVRAAFCEPLRAVPKCIGQQL